MGLLALWALNRQEAPLERTEASFDCWASRWLDGVTTDSEPSVSADRWGLVARFFDSLEANAEEFWHAPVWETTRFGERDDLAGKPLRQGLDGGDEDDLFRAAYENVSFRDSTSDGVESDMLEGAGGPAPEGELEFEARRLAPHLSFLVTLGKLWRQCVAAACGVQGPMPSAIRERLPAWQSHAETLRRELVELALGIQRHSLVEPLPSRESLLEFDRRRAVKEGLVERVLWAAWEVSLAEVALRLAGPAPAAEASPRFPAIALELIAALAAGDLNAVRRRWAEFLRTLAQQPLLYVPAAKGGDPRRVLAARLWQSLLCVLADRLPRAGLLVESCQLLDAVLERERRGSPGPGAVSEFDRFFETAYRALLEALLQAKNGMAPEGRPGRSARELVELVQRWNHALLGRWLAHSRLVRLSALEKVASSARWQELVGFIRRHGAGLFTQSFLNLGHLRSIRHQGAEAWIERTSLQPDAEEEYPFLADLDQGTPRKVAVECLNLIVDAVGENYGYYREYNGTTTQSDHGENLYMFLDFLRLLASYDRICWNMRPLVAAHDVLLADGDGEAAALWRESLAERTAEAADSHLARYAELARQYGLRLPAIYERLSERFVRPLAIDRVRALVKPALEEGRAGRPSAALAELREEIEDLLDAPAGSGMEVPGWLAALRDEVAHQEDPRRRVRFLEELPAGPVVRLSWDQIVEQLETWEEAAEEP
jgi:hypothetical protein